MVSDHSWRSLLLKGFQRLPTDLTIAMILTLLTSFTVIQTYIQVELFQIILSFLFILFLPGYVLIAALFPKQGDLPQEKYTEESQGANIIERVALAFVMSAATVPLIGLILTFTRWNLHPIPVVLSVSLFITIFSIIATIRRWRLPSEERFSIPYQRWTTRLRARLTKPTNKTDVMLNVAVALSILVVLTGVGFTAAIPHQGEQFTEFYLLTEDDGEHITDNYPERFVQGETQSVIVGIKNQEHETTNYTIIVHLERVEEDRSESEVIARDELDRFKMTLHPGETEYTEHNITPTMVGEDLRVTYLLYKGDIPEEPTKESSYQNLQLRITVEDTNIQDPIEIPETDTESLSFQKKQSG